MKKNVIAFILIIISSLACGEKNHENTNEDQDIRHLKMAYEDGFIVDYRIISVETDEATIDDFGYAHVDDYIRQNYRDNSLPSLKVILVQIDPEKHFTHEELASSLYRWAGMCPLTYSELAHIGKVFDEPVITTQFIWDDNIWGTRVPIISNDSYVSIVPPEQVIHWVAIKGC